MKNQKLLLATFASFLLVATIIGIVSSSVNSHKKHHSNKTHAALAILKATCSSAKYPELCYSAIASVPEVVEKLEDERDVILQSLHITRNAVQNNSASLSQYMQDNGKELTGRQSTAGDDCKENNDMTVSQIDATSQTLNGYPGKLNQQHASDLKTSMSSSITNQVSCLDGFSHSPKDKAVRNAIVTGQAPVEGMLSNTLGMIANLPSDDTENEFNTTKRELEEESDGSEGWPEWLSRADRGLLQSSSLTPDVVVAADGSGNHTTVSAAVAAAPKNNGKRYVIRIKAGIYTENVEIPGDRINIMFVGDGRETTIITGKRSVVDGSTTFRSATVAVVGKGFLARDITFQNTAGPYKNQAVALRVGSDLAAFYRCGMLGYQNTLYVLSDRQFFINCYITGTVDFIFGNSAALFQDCDIHARRPKPGQKITITAQGRNDPNENTGIVIQKCRIDAAPDLQSVRGNFPTYLGRPWKKHSRTVIMQSSLGDLISPAGWLEWKGRFALNTLYYAEYQNTGAGAGTSQRVNWKGHKVIDSVTEARQFTARNFIVGGSWLKSTTFPFSLDL